MIWKNKIHKATNALLELFRYVFRIAWSQFPLFVMLVVFTTIPACFSGFENCSPQRYLGIVVPQMILLSLILSQLAAIKRWIWWLIFTIANLMFLVELCCFYCQHTRFGSTIAVLLLQTNVNEASEFIGFSMIPFIKALLTSFGLIVLFIVWDRFWQKGLAERLLNILHLQNKFISGCVGAILAFSLIYSPLLCFWVNKELPTLHLTNMPKANNFLVYYYAIKDTFYNPDYELDVLVQTIRDTTVDSSKAKDNLTIVYVVGESFPRSHSSLYGYPFDTNPLMAQEIRDSSLFIFDNIISNSMQTIEVFRHTLSLSDVTADKPFVEYPLLLSILKKGNYNVAYYDNQSVINSPNFDFGCAYFLSPKEIQNQSIDTYNTQKCENDDGIFVDTYPPLSGNNRNFTVYHLMGQHVLYNKRYPKEFTYFTSKDYTALGAYTEEQAQAVSEYDNATRYNDFVLEKIINQLRDKTAIMIYVPDHGNEVYDYRDVHGRYPNDVPIESVKILYEVPLMVWVSDKYKELYPEEVVQLRKNTHKALFNGDLSHTILDIAGINTTYFRPEFSLIREGEGRTNRRIPQINFEYDKNRDKLKKIKMRYDK